MNKKAAVVEELHRPARRSYPRRHVHVRGLDETWQADLVDLTAYSSENKDYTYLLIIIDIFSKYAWAVPTKTKNEKDVTDAIGSMLQQGRVPQKLHVDRSKEFYNSEIKKLMKDYRITMKLKAHRTRKIKFKVGDKVRISKYKNVFEKGYTPNWTTEIFTISHVVNTNPVIYKLVDYEEKPVEGGFYQEELTRVTYPDVYLVEKILRRRGNRVFVKWLGFDSSHNSWIDKDDL
ncbi:uncharacterized protein LOC107042770 [Diachasma alloeum]|uniref:uncharacterized protein LOC107042770 n=1 Tax=Diachasma alloeum TaxID=454923 RepID=UPI00073816FD|nr:uncharacterized protein LOC107042770 [Diachasma alloeum]